MSEHHQGGLPEGTYNGTNSFAPDPDALASGILWRIRPGASIVVVPDSFNLQAANDALTIKTQTQIDLYRNTVDFEGRRQEKSPELISAVQQRIVLDTILIKIATVKEGGIALEGKIWHEFGHVLHGAPENGLVFAHELDSVRRVYGDAIAREWVVGPNRGLGYFATFAVNPGKDNLEAHLRALLTDSEYLDFEGRVRKIVEDKAAAAANTRSTGTSIAPPPVQQADPGVGESIAGTLYELQTRLGAKARGAKFMGTVEVDRQIKFADIFWIVVAIDGERFTLRRAK
ncbi:hypothetical protein ACN20G_19150 [Streptomyces sp. BI20]|uniref:hypothetical protein n=1 Tax=Streptomyces sp. BI20 TaxID=3403460 RepID=UPI003C74BB5C